MDCLIKPFTFERIKLALEKYRQRCELFHREENMSQNELDQLSLSLVTLRLYLDHQVELERLVKETSSGSVGRPTYQYFKVQR